MNKISWKIIDKYFTDNPSNLVDHHLDSFNNFFNIEINKIFNENNPIRFNERETVKNKDKRNQVLLYMGGKNGNNIYIGKPVIYDDNFTHYMYPNDARLRNMTYGCTIHYDVDVEFSYWENDEQKTHNMTLEKIYLGKFPIMVQSNLCILNSLSPDVRFNMGECRNDYGGYFIIGGKEKAIIPQEKFADNMIYIKENKADDTYSFSCEIRSVSEDTSKPIRATKIRIVAPSATLSNKQIVVDIPNVKKPMPLFIVMRALGVESDLKIIKTCLLDMEKNNHYVDLFIPSIHDASKIFNQKTALEYIASFTKRGTIVGTLEILSDYLLPHIGEMNFLDKAFFIGYMTYSMLQVSMKEKLPTDRDNFKFKRIELTGKLIYDLFREYYLIQNKEIARKIDEEYYYHKSEYVEQEGLDGLKKKKKTSDKQTGTSAYQNNFIGLIDSNFKTFFKERIVETGFKKAFKGNWGSQTNTKRLGVVQDLNRLSWNTYISHLRKINLPLDSSAKVVGPRLLNGSQWGYIDPVDTPDGGNIGLHKHLSLSTYITIGSSSTPIINWIRMFTSSKKIMECNYDYLAGSTKIFVNGNWIAVTDQPFNIIKQVKLYRRNGLFPVHNSVSFDYSKNEIHIYTDSGRLTRPIYYMENGKESYNREKIRELLFSNKITWSQILTGFLEKNEDFNYKQNILYTPKELLNNLPSRQDDAYHLLTENASIIDYIDTAEEEISLIAINENEIKKSKYYTNIEIEPSLMFGVMGNLIIYPENNPLPRNSFSCGQSKQAVSVYHSNYQMRIDKMGVVLNYGQIPLVKSRYLDYINKEQQPYGVNAIVAIMSFTGYNVEDAILINKGSLARGMFHTTYYSMYEDKEESSKVNGMVNSKFANIEKNNVINKKQGYDYSYLDEHGMVKEGTQLNDKIILIGKMNSNLETPDVFIDASVKTKKGQLGVVDKAFITNGEEGFNIAKIRIREERIPTIGDKMASRAGQKGTIGLIITESDMPFTADGLKPDLIINPHALPSRMTIGQIIESLLGVVCTSYGAFGDCTAFQVKGSNSNTYGKLLTNAGFHSSGNQILYNGMTGEQIESDIYIGPTYYMRLKHMVKDKINYRARGPNTGLTKQPVQGRANDGGLRIGEMERDGVLAHGMSFFLNESFMTRADEYYIAVCNKSGTIAIYNESRNLFLSPYVDGPLKFHKNPDNSLNIENISRFGRSFSILKVPYAFKLLIQELQVMNVQMRIITDQNIDQLMSMSYSNNILKLINTSKDDSSYNLQGLKLEINRLNSMIVNPDSKNDTKPYEPIPDYNPVMPDVYKQDVITEQPEQLEEKFVEDILKINDEQRKYKLLPGESDEKMELTEEMLINPTEAFYSKKKLEDGSEEFTNLFTGYKSIITSMKKEDQLYLIQQPIAIQNRILEEIYFNYGKAILEQKQLYNEGKRKTPFLKSIDDNQPSDTNKYEDLLNTNSNNTESSKSFDLNTTTNNSIPTNEPLINNDSAIESPPYALDTPDETNNFPEELEMIDILDTIPDEKDSNELSEGDDKTDNDNNNKKIIEIK